MGAEQSGHEGVVPSSGSDNDGALLDPGGCTGFCRKEPVFDKMRGNRSCTPSECVSRAKKLALFQAVPACAPPVCENTTKIRVQRAATPRRLVVGANKEATMGESSGHGASVAMPLRGASSTFVHGSPAKSNREPLVGIGAVLSIDPNRRGKDGAVFFSDFAKGSPSEEAARRGDLQIGDVLVEVRGRKISAQSVYEVASQLLGAAGTRVQIKVRRGLEQVLEVELERRQTSASAIQAIVDQGDHRGTRSTPAGEDDEREGMGVGVSATLHTSSSREAFPGNNQTHLKIPMHIGSLGGLHQRGNDGTQTGHFVVI